MLNISSFRCSTSLTGAHRKHENISTHKVDCGGLQTDPTPHPWADPGVVQALVPFGFTMSRPRTSGGVLSFLLAVVFQYLRSYLVPSRFPDCQSLFGNAPSAHSMVESACSSCFTQPGHGVLLHRSHLSSFMLVGEALLLSLLSRLLLTSFQDLTVWGPESDSPIHWEMHESIAPRLHSFDPNNSTWPVSSLVRRIRYFQLAVST